MKRAALLNKSDIADGQAFQQFARWSAKAAGRPGTFLFASLVVALWALLGPVFDFSNTWQLFINTGTTIVTFLMVFLLQNTQIRDNAALQIKLDELIRVNIRARNMLIDVESTSDDEIAAMRQDIITKK